MPMVHEPLRYAHEEGHTDVCFSEDGNKFVTCGADGDIRIWSTEDSEDPVHNCIGEWALCVRFKDDNLYVATGSNDIQILTFPDGDRNGVLDRFVAPINHIAIGKKNKIIALAAEDMEIKLINLERENKEVTIFDGISGPCLSVAICPNSKLLATGSGDSKMRIYDIEKKTLVKEFEVFPKVNSFANAKLLCRMDFDPIKGNFLAYPDKNSVVLLNTTDWTQMATLSSDDITASFSMVQYSPCGKYIAATTDVGDFVIFEVASEMVANKSKHPNSVSVCGLMWNPLGNGQIVYTDIEGQLGIVYGCIRGEKGNKRRISVEDSGMADNEIGITEKEDGFTENEVDFGDVQFEDDNDEDNENAVSVEKLKKQYMDDDLEPELGNLDSESSHAPTPRARTPEIPLQPAFMPSSTPEHLDPRYLCWNDIGIIRSYGMNCGDEDASKSIEVEFHDATFHNSMMLQNFHDYTMGSVSKSALVVANSSQLNVIPLSGGSREWLLKVEEYEEIVLVAVSENLVCFAMANYIVRICSIFGTQRAVISIPGPTVCMAAFKNLLLVAYHAADIRKGSQCISIKLVNFSGTSLDCKNISSALGPESTLQWLGFSDVGTPAMMDSLGMLSMHPHDTNIWIPFCDTSKHLKSPADGFFVTAVFESYQAVGGLKCKGTVYPTFTPRPTMCELPLEPPFAEPSTEKTQMEMNLFTWSHLQVNGTEKKTKEVGIKLFALACKNNLDQRAIEFMEILSNPQLLTIGIKYASKLEKRRLAEKLMELASKITNDEDDYSVPNTPVCTPEINTLKPVHRKLSLNSSKYASKHKLLNKEATTPDASQKSTQGSEAQIPSSSKTNLDSTLNTQESLFSEEEPKNPFLKSLKKQAVKNSNPLSLTDKHAGIICEMGSERGNNLKNGDAHAPEKRKKPDSETDKPKEKQRKLDRFMFSKRS